LRRLSHQHSRGGQQRFEHNPPSPWSRRRTPRRRDLRGVVGCEARKNFILYVFSYTVIGLRGGHCSPGTVPSFQVSKASSAAMRSMNSFTHVTASCTVGSTLRPSAASR